MANPPPPGGDAAPVGGSAIDLQFVGHATVRLDLGGLRVLTDPFLRDRLGPLERHGPIPDPDDLGVIDVVVISHGHPDHFDRPSLARLPGRPVVIVPRGLGQATAASVPGDVVEMIVGERVEVGALSITALPARHWISPGAPRAEPIGYLLDAGRPVYFAGDTGPLPDLGRLAGDVEVALLPVWTWGPHRGPGHLGPRSAAEATAVLTPTVAVPIHWGTLYPRRLHHLWRGPLDEPGDRFAVHARRLAPDVDVRVLRPGMSTTILGRSD
jgi:L-ascorbate metabolism protein UlaG (beta-lactamase superfamily)